MKNNTKVRLRLSKQLFESLTREIINEAKKANDGYTVAVKQPKQPKQSKAQADSPEVQKTDAETKMEATQGQEPTASTSTLAKNFRAKAQELPKMQGISSREAQSLQKLIDTILAKAPGGELAMAIDKAQRALDTASQNIKTGEKQQTHSPGSDYTKGSFMGQRGEEKPSKFTSGVAKPAANQRFEEMETKVAEEGQLNEIDPSALDIGAIVSGMAAIGVTPVLVDKFWQYVKKKNPKAYEKAQSLSGAMDKSVGGNRPGQGHGVDTRHTFGPQE